MSKKFSIATVVNTSILDNEIAEYLKSNKEFPYIFMNEDTANAITSDEAIPNIKNVVYKNGIVGRYCGYKVFLDNYLNFGEVEIR